MKNKFLLIVSIFILFLLVGCERKLPNESKIYIDEISNKTSYALVDYNQSTIYDALINNESYKAILIYKDDHTYYLTISLLNHPIRNKVSILINNELIECSFLGYSSITYMAYYSFICNKELNVCVYKENSFTIGDTLYSFSEIGEQHLFESYYISNYDNYLIHYSKIDNGLNYGLPIFDSMGYVLGFKYYDNDLEEVYLSSAIQSKYIYMELKSLISKTTRYNLGLNIRYKSIYKDEIIINNDYVLPPNVVEGVFVSGLSHFSPAYNILKQYDFIHSINGIKIDSYNDYIVATAYLFNPQNIELQIYRLDENGNYILKESS